jgi:hypothetical protein
MIFVQLDEQARGDRMASAIVFWSILGAAAGTLSGSIKFLVPEEVPQCKVDLNVALRNGASS